MSLDNPGSGFGHYSAYSCPGLPWVSNNTLSGVKKVEFPNVTQEIQIFNQSAAAVSVGFTQTSFTAGLSLTVPVSGSLMLPVRVVDLYLSGTGQVSVFGSLSMVNRREMPALSGSWTGI